jgi:hypothetical protein
MMETPSRVGINIKIRLMIYASMDSRFRRFACSGEKKRAGRKIRAARGLFYLISARRFSSEPMRWDEV